MVLCGALPSATHLVHVPAKQSACVSMAIEACNG
jgi:hypothetical protein